MDIRTKRGVAAIAAAATLATVLIVFAVCLASLQTTRTAEDRTDSAADRPMNSSLDGSGANVNSSLDVTDGNSNSSLSDERNNAMNFSQSDGYKGYNSHTEDPTNDGYYPLHFSQRADHFDDGAGVFSQRYWLDNSFYRDGGPVFIDLAGEQKAISPFRMAMANLQWIRLAKELGAVYFVLEHR